MIKKGVVVDLNNGYGILFIFVCRVKNIIVVKMLLIEGFDVNFECGKIMLFIFVLDRYCIYIFLSLDYDKKVINLIKLLVEYGVNVNLVIEDLILLKVVCMEGKFDCVKELIKVGVDVNLEVGNEILLMVVCRCGNIDVIKELIKVEVNINLKVGDKILLVVVCELN